MPPSREDEPTNEQWKLQIKKLMNLNKEIKYRGHQSELEYFPPSQKVIEWILETFAANISEDLSNPDLKFFNGSWDASWQFKESQYTYHSKGFWKDVHTPEYLKKTLT